MSVDENSARVGARAQIMLDEGWSFRRLGDEEWLPAIVPGSNFSDLFRNGLIDDPMFGDNETRLQWIEREDWEYRCTFELSAHDLEQESIELVFEGLDTYCDVALNGSPIISGENMFCTYRAECRTLLRPGENELRLVFKSPLAPGSRRRAADGFRYPAENDKTADHVSVYVRKAPYHFGWDWGPKYVTSGVWRPAYLDLASAVRIRDASWTLAQLSERAAEIALTIEVESLGETHACLEIGCDGPGVVPLRIPVALAKGTRGYHATLAVEEPKLWWPNGLGEPFLYRFDVRLVDQDAILDRTSLAVGIRTIEVVNQPDEYGESFYLKVNGVPVFMKGANYIPPDSFQERITPERYRQIIADAVNANMNMLRVWGGGVYERDLFYDLADEHGILIWQDFIFSCTLYPSDPHFVALVREEARQAVRRLRRHACLALWCGNNEVSLGIAHWHWPQKYDYTPELFARLVAENQTLFEELLPSIVREHDPGRFYFPSSPIGHWEDPADDARGDGHYWGVWHGERPFSTYEERVSRFMSEYGFQSYPLIASIERFAPEGGRYRNAPALAVHQKHPRGEAIIDRFVLEHFGVPRSFEHFCYVTQVLQADGLRVAFEAHRRNMPFCMGSLYWQLNDCWPAISWSSIDYYGSWKALHYQAARSFAEVLLSIEVTPEGWIVHGISDLASDLAATLTIECATFSGEIIWTRSRSVLLTKRTARILERVGAVPAYDPSCTVVSARLALEGRVIASTTRMLEDVRKAALEDPRLRVEAIGTRGVMVSAQSFARAVQLSADAADGSAMPLNFEDNFFDLMAGEQRTIRLRGGRILDPASVRAISIYDAVEPWDQPDRRPAAAPLPSAAAG